MAALPPLSANLVLNSATGAGDKNSRPFYWPGGEGELNVKGDLGGASAKVTLFQGFSGLTAAQRASAANYKPHGSTIAADNGADRFFAGEGWMYVALDNTGGTDNCQVWVARTPNHESLTGYLDPSNTDPVS